jgi:catalase-peroxidase
MNIVWEPSSDDKEDFIGKDRSSQQGRWTASRFDLMFGSNSQLRAIAEYYACEDSNQKFIKDFIKAWTKVMNLDRFNIH